MKATTNTPETDAFCEPPMPDERMWYDFARKLERARDEAFSLLTAEKSTRNAIIKKGVELEKKLEAMREAIQFADQLFDADGYEIDNIARAKLQPFLKP